MAAAAICMMTCAGSLPIVIVGEVATKQSMPTKTLPLARTNAKRVATWARAAFAACFTSAAFAQDAPFVPPVLDPFQIGYYGKLYAYKAPNGEPHVPPVKVGGLNVDVGLRYLEDRLNDLRRARDGLRDMCLGFHGDKQVVGYRGRRVAASPEWLRACDRRAALLASGVPALDEALKKWNVIAGTNYVQPRALDDVAAWTRKKVEFVHFGGTACDDASHDIMIRAPLGQVNPTAIYERNKGSCSPEWSALFEPAEMVAERANEEAKARMKCRPGTTFMIVDEKSGNGAREGCNEEDRTVDADALKAALFADIEAGGYRTAGGGGDTAPDPAAEQARRDALREGGGMRAGVERGVADAGAAVRILAQEAGQLAAAASMLAPGSQVVSGGLLAGGTGSRPSSGVVVASSGCDDTAEAQSSVQMQEARMQTIAGLPPRQQSCQLARLYVDIFTRGLNYVKRCNRTAQIPEINKELARNRALVRQECAN